MFSKFRPYQLEATSGLKELLKLETPTPEVSRRRLRRIVCWGNSLKTLREEIETNLLANDELY